MALSYQWAFDLEQVGAVAVGIDDADGARSARLATDVYAHTSFGSVASATGFAAALQAALNSGTSFGTYTVSFSAATGYTISYTGTFSWDFGTTVTASEGTRMRQILGLAGDLGSVASAASAVRPYYLILPAIAARSTMSDEYEPSDVASEAVSDDGSDYQIARDTSEIWSDWTQQAETETAPTAFGAGTLVFKRQAVSAAPWTYQHAWEHSRLGEHPFLVVDGSEQAVHRLRADGASFRPQRFAGQDLPHWTMQFRTRLLGRL